MNLYPDINQQSDLRQKIREAADAMAQTCLERLQVYEAEHGAVTPAPAGTKFKARTSEAQQMAVTKRILITNGWLKTEGENLTKLYSLTHDDAMAELTQRIESLGSVAIPARRK